MYTLDSIKINDVGFDPGTNARIPVSDLSRPIKVQVDYHVPDAKPLYGTIGIRVYIRGTQGNLTTTEGERQPLQRQGVVTAEFQPQVTGDHSLRMLFGDGPIYEQKFVLTSAAPASSAG
jgi:hypothetical protein